jgi:hypothetical protein
MQARSKKKSLEWRLLLPSVAHTVIVQYVIYLGAMLDRHEEVQIFLRIVIDCEVPFTEVV